MKNKSNNIANDSFAAIESKFYKSLKPDWRPKLLTDEQFLAIQINNKRSYHSIDYIKKARNMLRKERTRLLVRFLSCIEKIYPSTDEILKEKEKLYFDLKCMIRFLPNDGVKKAFTRFLSLYYPMLIPLLIHKNCG
jgi:hypothetical protein